MSFFYQNSFQFLFSGFPRDEKEDNELVKTGKFQQIQAVKTMKQKSKRKEETEKQKMSGKKGKSKRGKKKLKAKMDTSVVKDQVDPNPGIEVNQSPKKKLKTKIDTSIEKSQIDPIPGIEGGQRSQNKIPLRELRVHVPPGMK